MFDDFQQQVYRELRALAGAKMASERVGHTLDATALVHEAWLRLQREQVGPDQRTLFFHAAAQSMRRILIEHARSRGRIKRGGRLSRVPLGVAELALSEQPGDILLVDEAIERLSRSDALAGDVVRLRFYAGLSIEETAQALGISKRSVDREWAYARARLTKDLVAD